MAATFVLKMPLNPNHPSILLKHLLFSLLYSLLNLQKYTNQ